MKLTILLLFLASCQSLNQKVEADPDDLYRKFVAAYDQLDAEALANLYVDDACLLNLYDGAASNSLCGEAAIAEYFSDFFNRFQENKQQLILTFKVASREKSGEHYLDNGFYELKYITPGQADVIGFGKFSTVLVVEEGEWKFQVDATTNTDAAEYEAEEAKLISIKR